MTASGAPIQPIVFTGLRGMGKTALLRLCLADATQWPCTHDRASFSRQQWGWLNSEYL